jgi:hypothetical protein
MTPGRILLPGALLAAAALAAPARAQQDPPDAGGAPDPAPLTASASPPLAPPPRAWASCAEHVPPGATRPEIKESFPQSGLSGYAARLEVTVHHGKGETVLPEGFRVEGSSDAAKALEQAGFVIPEPEGGAGPTLSRQAPENGSERATTTVSIPFVPLPEKPGRSLMQLPPVPISITRASGEVVTVCTQPHPIAVEDPIANDPDPKVRPNPPPRPQREDWALARQLTYGVLAGAALALVLAWLVRRWLRRPRPVPAPPPVLPWIAALEELEAIRRSTLLAEGRTDEFFDRVSDCVRRYLGARYGFDGLESTSDEMRALLRRVRPPVPVLPQIGEFLADCDLVKFARVQPVEQDCLDALRRGETIVRRTVPPAMKPRREGPPNAGPRTRPEPEDREEAAP